MKRPKGENWCPKLFAGILTFGIVVFVLLVGFYSPDFSPTQVQWSSLRKVAVTRHNATLPRSHNRDKTSNTSRQKEIPSPKRTFIVNTPTCKIPQLDPWDESIHLMKCSPEEETDPNCPERADDRKWMYLQGSELIFNGSALHGTAYAPSSLHCCYQVIQRKEQSLKKFNVQADTTVGMSDRCHPISLEARNTIKEEFIKVRCNSRDPHQTALPVYHEYFALAQPDAAAKKKISKWKTIRAKDPGVATPPNVVILGIDCNSRLNSHRRLPQTLKALQKMEAVELLGYTKVGDNTLPNTIAFLAGMVADDMLQQCYPKQDGSFDGCPFIWKEFDRAGYLTATVEEAPLSTSFNYYRNGFVVKPVDFYYRPFILASSAEKWNIKCVGHHSTMELLLNYLDDILRRGSDGAPVFIHSWTSFYSHDCINSLRFVDGVIAQFVEAMDKQNTILVLLGDHGFRIGPFRESTLGWYEDKLPALWMYLPERVRERWPLWQSNLKLNAPRLTTHFDLYQTFVHILHSYKVDPHFRVKTPSPPKGQSLLKPVRENRTCGQAGIPEGYCACSEPKPLALTITNEMTLKEVATAGLSYLAKMLPRSCVKLTIKKIVSGQRMATADGGEVFLVKLYTTPGDYLFEVTSSSRKIPLYSEEETENEGFLVEGFDSIARLNMFDSHRNCVRDAIFEKYCYCSH